MTTCASCKTLYNEPRSYCNPGTASIYAFWSGVGLSSRGKFLVGEGDVHVGEGEVHDGGVEVRVGGGRFVLEGGGS